MYCFYCCFFFFKQKTAYEMRISDWSSDVCSSDLKGGVGKSTVAANLAIALHRAGRAVGLVDADIYGPSQPKLLGVEGSRPQARDKVLQPVATPYGVPLLSMGQLVAAATAIALHATMVSVAPATPATGPAHGRRRGGP